MENKCKNRARNIVRKGEIACYKQFLLFSQCFHTYLSLVRQNAALCGMGITLSQTSPGFYVSVEYKSFENIVGKGEIARNVSSHLENFLLFSNLKLVCKLFQSGRV